MRRLYSLQSQTIHAISKKRTYNYRPVKTGEPHAVYNIYLHIRFDGWMFLEFGQLTRQLNDVKTAHSIHNGDEMAALFAVWFPTGIQNCALLPHCILVV